MAQLADITNVTFIDKDIGDAAAPFDVIETVIETDIDIGVDIDSQFSQVAAPVAAYTGGRFVKRNVSFDLPVIGTVIVPYQWVTGNRAMLRRHLKKLGWELSGAEYKFKVIKQDDAIAMTIVAQL